MNNKLSYLLLLVPIGLLGTSIYGIVLIHISTTDSDTLKGLILFFAPLFIMAFISEWINKRGNNNAFM